MIEHHLQLHFCLQPCRTLFNPRRTNPYSVAGGAELVVSALKLYISLYFIIYTCITVGIASVPFSGDS